MSNFRKLLYEEIMDLHSKHLICGRLRSFKASLSTNEIKGYCSLCEDGCTQRYMPQSPCPREILYFERSRQ